MRCVFEAYLPKADLQYFISIREPISKGRNRRRTTTNTGALYPLWSSPNRRYAPQTREATARGGENDFSPIGSPGKLGANRAFVRCQLLWLTATGGNNIKVVNQPGAAG